VRRLWCPTAAVDVIDGTRNQFLGHLTLRSSFHWPFGVAVYVIGIMKWNGLMMQFPGDRKYAADDGVVDAWDLGSRGRVRP
jgi:hypothetical protein